MILMDQFQTNQLDPSQTKTMIERARKFCPTFKAGDRVGVRAGWAKAVSVKDNQGRMEVECIATTNRVDSVGEVILPEGGSWAPLEAHKSIFGDHWYGLGDKVGSFRSISLYPNAANPVGWKVRFSLLPADYSELVNQCRILASENQISMSIGYFPTEWGAPSPAEAKRFPGAEIITRKWVGFEISVVAMPCNLDAVGGGLAIDETKADDIRRLVHKGLLSGRSLRVPAPKAKNLLIL